MKKRRESGKASIPDWMLTYSDMVTLLLVFFVLLLSVSKGDSVRNFVILSFFQGNVGFLKGGNTLSESDFHSMGQDVMSLPSDRSSRFSREKVKGRNKLIKLKSQVNSKYVRIDETEKGVVVSLMSDVLFDPGSEVIRYKDVRGVLEGIRELIDELNEYEFIDIEGHADDVGISRKDPWDLSVRRALSVRDALEKIPYKNSLNQRKISVRGFGNVRPIREDGSPETRAFNRRVDIVLRRDE